MALPFERAGYVARIASVKRRMDAAGADVLVVVDPIGMSAGPRVRGFLHRSPALPPSNDRQQR